jgi:demethylmenaquinone methyltransferase/2-methoxy-6-polyprenyl-1,4-benzoquinol methylase
MHVLDVATGTGLLARQAVRITGATGTVFGLDLSAGMLAEARRTLEIPLIQGTAEHLPLVDASVDFLTMGYALRHAADLLVAFGEFYRVLRHAGTLLILEISPPASRFGRSLMRFYMQRCLPYLAKWTTGQQETQTLMRYYWDTIAHCVPPETILGTMQQVGFTDTRCDVELGLFRAYSGRKQ